MSKCSKCSKTLNRQISKNFSRYTHKWKASVLEKLSKCNDFVWIWHIFNILQWMSLESCWRNQPTTTLNKKIMYVIYDNFIIGNTCTKRKSLYSTLENPTVGTTHVNNCPRRFFFSFFRTPRTLIQSHKPYDTRILFAQFPCRFSSYLNN